MSIDILPSDLPKLKNDGACNHLLNLKIPNISLPNQDGNFLKLSRIDTFRLVIFCFPMTGRPDRLLPHKWNLIPGAKGCTPQVCSFRDEYDNLIINNAIPIGISTQSVEDIKEMTVRLQVPFDILSDQQLLLSSILKLPTFNVKNKEYIKRLTLIIDNSKIKYVFYPVFPINNHIKKVLEWLKAN